MARSHFRPLLDTAAFNLGVAIGCSALCLAACSEPNAQPPEHDGQNNIESDSDPYRCVESVSELTPDRQALFGFTPESVRARLERSREVSLGWQQATLTYGPEAGASTIAIEVTETGAARFIDRSIEVREGWVLPADVSEESLGCTDVMRIAGEVHVSTPGGALEEFVPVEFDVGPEAISITEIAIPLQDLGGQFAAELAAPSGYSSVEDAELRLHLGVLDLAVVGDIYVTANWVGADGQRRATESSRVAQFPADSGCGPEHRDLSSPELLRRVARAEALAQLNAHSPVAVLRAGSSVSTELTLAFEHSDDSVCANDDALHSALLFPARAALRAADASIDGALDVDVIFVPGLSRTSASASSVSRDPSVMATLPATFGIREEIGLSGYAMASAEFQAGVSELDSWGTLGVYGLGSCAADAGTCADSERALLWGVSWGDEPALE